MNDGTGTIGKESDCPKDDQNHCDCIKDISHDDKNLCAMKHVKKKMYLNDYLCCYLNVNACVQYFSRLFDLCFRAVRQKQAFARFDFRFIFHNVALWNSYTH